MNPKQNDLCTGCSWLPEFFARLQAALDSHFIYATEFNYNAALRLVQGCENCMRRCLGGMRLDLVPEFASYLQEFLVPCDFMPCPGPLVAGTRATDVIEEKKRELRPKYMLMYRIVNELATLRKKANP